MAATLALFATLCLEHWVLLSGYNALGFFSPMFWLRPLTAVLLAIPGMDTGGLLIRTEVRVTKKIIKPIV